MTFGTGATNRIWVYITEGERDADNLAERCAPMLTTTVHSGWSGVDVSYLADREAVVIVDNDPAGFARGKVAADAEHAAGASLVTTMRPPRRFRDVSDMLAAGLDCGALEPVNLHTEDPPTSGPEDERPGRPVRSRSGDATSIRVPVRVFLLLEERGVLERGRDRRVWELLEERAHRDTHEASVTLNELADLEGVAVRTISRSIKRLQAAGLVRDVKRGRWFVLNPAGEGRHGDVDLTGTYRHATNQPTLPVPFHSHVPYMSPRKQTSETDSSDTRD